MPPRTILAKLETPLETISQYFFFYAEGKTMLFGPLLIYIYLHKMCLK